ncbi:MAG: tryptophan synthase subunit alpha, partial [bacterium TMED264]
EAGADMIEIGIPYSDPLADGPIIQASSQKALNNGITLDIIFDQVKSIRSKTEIPLVMMGCYNPILKWGHKKFLKRCSTSGVDGLILPDLPLDEAEEFCILAKSMKIAPILLVAPNTSNDRIKKISKLSGTLIYAVSILGITGNKLETKRNLQKYLDRVRVSSYTPFVVGFGISSNDDVSWVNKYSDGAVVGSAIIKMLEKSKNPVHETKQFIKYLRGKK